MGESGAFHEEMRKRSTNQPVEGRQLSDRQKDGTERKHTTHPEPGRGSNGYSTFSSAALRHLRFWSISLICSSISRQRLLVTVTGVAQARLWGGRKVKKDTARKQAAKRGGGGFFPKNGKKTPPWSCYVMSGRGGYKGSTNTCARQHCLCYARPRRCQQGSTSCLPLPLPSSSPGKKEIKRSQVSRATPGGRAL